MSYAKNCVICGNEFKSNYERVVTCSDPCRITKRREYKRINSKEYYHKNKKPKYVNSFLMAKL